jgi:hypothetical protein
MKLIRFKGDGKESPDAEIYHLEGCHSDHTLCGDTLDNDPATTGHFEYVDKPKVTCPLCVDIIRHCRGVKI